MALSDDYQLNIPEDKLRDWGRWLNEIRSDWRGEIPSRIHEGNRDGWGASPPFAPEFISYIGHLMCKDPACEACRRERKKLHNKANPDSRVRATRAFRKLRMAAPKEFDALYSVAVLGYSIPETARRLSENAVVKGHPERYTVNGTTVLVLSGIDKVIYFWRRA